MTVPPIDVTQMGATAQPVRAPKQTMDSEVFMHLLVTQLANQDPSSPMDTNEMIAQSTQLASMERLNALSATQDAALDVQQRTAAAALVGREASTGGSEPVNGFVTAVSFSGGEPMVTIGELQVPYSQVVSVRQAAAAVPAAAVLAAAVPAAADLASDAEAPAIHDAPVAESAAAPTEATG